MYTMNWEKKIKNCFPYSSVTLNVLHKDPDEEWSLVSSLLSTEKEELVHGSSIDMPLWVWLSRKELETCVWLSCEILSKALNLASGFVSLRLIIGAWTAIFPSIILTTEDIDGLRVGEGLVHKRAKQSSLIASSEE